MYKIDNKKRKTNKIINKIDFVNLDGFVMPSKNKYFIINSERIKDIKIVDDKLMQKMISKKVIRIYQRLIKELTNLLIEENDDEGQAMRQILDKIEKFRQEIKFKYKSYLKKKDLELMGKQLKMFQNEAKKRYESMYEYNYAERISRSR